MIDMSPDRFLDRLDAATYTDDPAVGVFEADPGEADAVWLPERLFARLVRIAPAYELHTLPMLGGEAVRLNRLQCEDLLDEVAFVAERVNDPLAVEAAQALTDYVAVRMRRPAWSGVVTFEGN
jgi:hypothetical protein